MNIAPDSTGSQPISPRAHDSRQTRRTFLGSVGLGVATLGIGSGLAACGSSSKPASTATTPKRGGTLTVGLTGGGSSDTLNPLYPLLSTDVTRVNQLFEPLVTFTPEAGVQLLLAEELTPNHDATEWTIRLKRGVTFHNGKDLTAEDVAYTLQQIINPKSPGGGANLIASIDLSGIKQVDKLTLRVPFHSSFSILPQVFPCCFFGIIPVGFDLKKPVGTGPFRYDSFTPGQSSTFVRNPDYWQSGLPYLDRVVITDYSDETSQLNALSTSEANVVSLLSAASITTAKGTGQVAISQGGGFTPFTMRVDARPYDCSEGGCHSEGGGS